MKNKRIFETFRISVKSFFEILSEIGTHAFEDKKEKI